MTAPLLSSILRKRLQEDLLAGLGFRPNPYFAAADKQQDDGYGAVCLDYEDGSKAQLTEEIFRSQINREIENRTAREPNDPKGERPSWWARSIFVPNPYTRPQQTCKRILFI